MITEDLTPVRIDQIASLFNVFLGNEDPFDADADMLESTRAALSTWIVEVAYPAADALIEVHKATGIDLKNWEPVLRLVQSVRPKFSIEGEPEW